MTSQPSHSLSLISLPQLLARNWWLFLLRGVAALIFGVLSLVWPGISLATLILLFGAYALVDGAFALAAAIVGTLRDRKVGSERRNLWRQFASFCTASPLATLT